MVEIAEVVLVLVFETVSDVGTPLLAAFSIVLSLTSCAMAVLICGGKGFVKRFEPVPRDMYLLFLGLALLSRTLV
eukprot:5104355-Ditylum_brightwellii.AAC.1